MAGNLLSSNEKLVVALNVDRKSLREEYRKRLARPTPSIKIKDAPVQEIVIDDVDLEQTLPIPTFHEKEKFEKVNVPGAAVAKAFKGIGQLFAPVVAKRRWQKWT